MSPRPPARRSGRRRASREIGVRHAVLPLLVALSLGQAPIPSRIVSTSPSITETLFALGLGDRVVGVSSYCRYPAEVSSRQKVGTFLKPDTEIIARLRPDHVFVHAGPSGAAGQLKQLGLATTVVGRGSLAGVFDTIRQVGAAAGVGDRAGRLVADLAARLDRITASVAGRPPVKVLIVVGRRTGTLADIVAVGPGSYLDDIATLAGGANVLGSTGMEYPRISLESVIGLAPDVIVDVGEMGESPADAERRRAITEALWRAQPLVRAARTGRVHVVHDEAFVVPGPRIVDVAATMARWFHEGR